MGADKKVGFRPSEQNLKDAAFQRSMVDIISQVFIKYELFISSTRSCRLEHITLFQLGL